MVGFFKDSVYRVARLIFLRPSRTFHIRLLEKETGLSTTAVTKAVSELEQLGIISVEKTSITTDVRADIDSEEYFFYKRLFNLYILKDLTADLVRLFHPKAIVLFGSFGKGEDDERSDIDILLLSSEKNTKSLESIRSSYGKVLERVISITVVESLDSDEFKNTIANGIVLHGFIRVV